MINRAKLLLKRLHSLFKFGIYRYIKTKLRMTKLEFSLVHLPDEPGSVSHDVKIIFHQKVNKGAKPIFRNLPRYIDGGIYDGSVLSPKVSCHSINNAHVVGRTEFIFKDKKAYFPGIIDPKADMFMAEIEGHASITDDFNSISISVIKGTRKIDQAVSLFGQANGNYLHFLTEILSRLAVLDSLDTFFDASLLIEDNLHPKFYEALELLNVNGLNVIRISPYEMVFVEELLYISPICYTPPETRCMFTNGSLASPRRDQFVFSREGLELLRTKSVKISKKYVPCVTKRTLGINAKKHKNTLDTPGYIFYNHGLVHSSDTEFVFLERRAVTTGNGRLVKNQDRIIHMLQNHGFICFDIADFLFEEQVMVLRDSKIVVSPVGASLGNLIFCEPGMNVVLISPVFPGATFFYFANLMSCLGHNVTFVLGKQAIEQGVGYQEFYNRDFTVPINEVLSAVHHYHNDE
jgi:hypothetical protein